MKVQQPKKVGYWLLSLPFIEAHPEGFNRKFKRPVYVYSIATLS